MEYKYHTTAIRLQKWREYKHRRPSDGPLPPRWFGQLHPPTVVREKGKTPALHYGEGIGGNIHWARPDFRFRGYADEVVQLRHTGWYGDEEGHTLYRGVVFQIPARGGRPQYLAGVEWGENGRRFEPGGGWIEFGRGDIYESAVDAAHAADAMARIAGEKALEEEEREREAEREAAEEAERLEAANHEYRMKLADTPTNGAD